jgi:hypothetical protein
MRDAELGDIASFKALYTSLLDKTLDHRASLLIPTSQIQLPDLPPSGHVFQLAEFVDTNQSPKEVWLTWHYQ